MDEPGQGRFQACRLKGRVASLGTAQEQAGHELRDNGSCSAVLLPARHPGESGRAATGLSVCGRAQGHN